MIQIIPFTTGQQANGLGFTYWFDLFAGCSSSASGLEATANVPVAAAGTFRNLVINLDAAPGSGRSFTFLLRKNGTSTGLSVTISGADTSARITGVDVAVAVGDIVNLQQSSSGGPSNTSFSGSIEFESVEAGVSIYGGGGLGFVSGGVTRYDGPFRIGTFLSLSSAAEASQVVAAAGAITSLYGWVSGAPGASTGVTFYLNKNGVRQDGSGGTVNTALAVVGVAGPVSNAFTLDLVPGDVVYIEGVREASIGFVWYSLGVKFVATTDGEAMVAGYRATRNVDAECWFAVPQHGFGNMASDSAPGASFIAGPTAFALKNPRMLLDASPGAGMSRNIVLRANGADTSVAVSIADSNVSGAGATSQAFADGDRVSLRHFGTGGGSATRTYAWTFVIGPAVFDPVVFDPDTLSTIGLIWVEAYLPT